MTRIYLDHAATSPLRPEARAAMEEGFAIWANPSSPHAEGRKAKVALEDARERCKKALGWDGELIFTSGASEALAIGLQRAKVERRIVTDTEHDAVYRAAPNPETFDDYDFSGNAVLALQHVNSETGSINSVDQAAVLLKESGTLLLCDCSQSAGKLSLPNADMLVISAHKFGGPIGIGALLVRDFALLEPIGGHERGYRQGTENLPAAVGMAAALDARDWMTSSEQRLDFVERLGAGVIKLPQQVDYIVPLTHPSMSAQALLIRLDGMGFAVSAGSACSSGSLKPSRVLKAFGLDDETASRTIRVSMGWSTTTEELDAFADAWASLT